MGRRSGKLPGLLEDIWYTRKPVAIYRVVGHESKGMNVCYNVKGPVALRTRLARSNLNIPGVDSLRKVFYNCNKDHIMFITLQRMCIVS